MHFGVEVYPCPPGWAMGRLAVALALLALVPLSHAPQGLSVSPQGWSNEPDFLIQWEEPSFNPTAVCAKFWEPPSGPGDFDVREAYSPSGLWVRAPAEGEIPVYVWFEEGNASYWSEASSVVIRYDATAPSISVKPVLPTGYATSTTLILELEAEDALSGLQSTRAWEEGRTADWVPFTGRLEVQISPTEGAHRIIVEVSDRAGNVASSLVEVVADFSPPDVEVGIEGAMKLEGIWVTANGTVLLEVNARDPVSGISAVLLSWNEDMRGYVLVGGPVVVSLPSTGMNTLYVMAINGAGIPTRAIPVRVYLDVHPPVLAVPRYDKVVFSGGEFSMKVVASDDFLVESLIVDGRRIPYSENVTMEADWEHGVREITVIALDVVGHRSNAVVLQVYCFASLPRLELSYRNVTTEAYVRVSIRVIGDLGKPLLVHVGNSTLPFSGNVTIPIEPTPGPHALTISVEDDLGVVSEPEEILVYLDLAPPVSGFAVNGTILVVHATDDSWVRVIQLMELDRGGWRVIASLEPGGIVELDPGVHTLATIAVDGAGRVEPWTPEKPRTVVIDVEPPSSRLRAVLLDNGTILLTVNATDDTGIRQVFIQVRDGEWRTIAENATKLYFRPEGGGRYYFRSIAVDLSGKAEEKEGYDAVVRVGGFGIRKLLPILLVPLLVYALGPRILAAIRSIRR